MAVIRVVLDEEQRTALRRLGASSGRAQAAAELAVLKEGPRPV